MKQTFKILSLITFCILTILGCANRGSGPQGGPKDTTPPKLLKCTPENGATNVTSNKIQLT
ncbi:MAG: Ig-like domain-containing protein, partial [Paludibacteraceae bacterium]|nr:Ig-like domain-containing protein [Paludibacteraceae bacterium]